MIQTKIRDLDVVLLTFDEPNADANYADLLTKIPTAKRSHGVKGFDAAHQAAAAKAQTSIFVTVDGDNQIDPALLDLRLSISVETDFIISLNSINSVNGLTYGNGSVKIWSKGFIENMMCHERADPNASVQQKLDFCWLPGYFSTRSTHYSTTYISTTPFQAWRAGYREGIKLFLRYMDTGMWDLWHRETYLVWASVGADIENGTFAMDGAIAGAWDALTGEDVSQSADYDWCMMRQQCWTAHNIENGRQELGACFDLPCIPTFSAEASRWYKTIRSLGPKTEQVYI